MTHRSLKQTLCTPLALVLAISAAGAQEAVPAAPAVPPALPDGQSALPLVAVPSVADAGLADVRNRAAADTPALSMEEAVTLALQNNPSPKAARAQLDAALARIGIARAAAGPQLGLGGQVNAQRGFGNVSTRSGSGDVFGFASSQSLSLNASLPLYNGGRIKASRRAAEAQARSQLASAQQTEQDLAAQTILGFLSILQNQQLLEVAESNLATSQERRRVAGVRFDAGAAARLEVLRADSDLASARQRRIAAANNVAQSKAVVNILLGRNPETPFNAAPLPGLDVSATTATATTATASAAAGTPGSTAAGSGVLALPAIARFPLAEQATAIASGQAGPASPELRSIASAGLPSLEATRQSIEAADQNIAQQKAQRKPNISASLGGVLSNPAAGLGRFLVSLGVGLAQTLFDSGRISSQVTEATAQAQQVRYTLDSQQLQVANIIESALLQLDSARKRQTSADVSVLSAQEALRAAQLGYSAGAGTALDVTDAQNALLAAQTDAVNARFEVAQAQVQLAAATSQSAAGRTSGSGTGSGSTFSSSSTGSGTGVSTVSTNSASSQSGSSGIATSGNR